MHGLALFSWRTAGLWQGKGGDVVGALQWILREVRCQSGWSVRGVTLRRSQACGHWKRAAVGLVHSDWLSPLFFSPLFLSTSRGFSWPLER